MFTSSEISFVFPSPPTTPSNFTAHLLGCIHTELLFTIPHQTTLQKSFGDNFILYIFDKSMDSIVLK